MTSPRQSIRGEKKEDSAAFTIQNHYRTYLKEKSTLVKKNWLLPFFSSKIKEESKITTESKKPNTQHPPLSKTKNEEIAALFFHIDLNKHEISFMKKGYSALFPVDNNSKKSNVNLPLLNHYIRKEKDIREWVLEAYLRGRINSDTLLSLFQIQHAALSYFPMATTEEKHTLIQVMPIHSKGKITLSPPLLLQIKHLLPPNETKTDGSELHLIFNELISTPSEHNYFTLIHIPKRERYEIAYITLSAVNLSTDGMVDGGESRQLDFLMHIAELLGVTVEKNTDAFLKHNTLKELVLDRLMTTEQKEALQKNTDKQMQFMDKVNCMNKIILMLELIFNGDARPLIYHEKKKSHMSLVLHHPATQQAILKKITGQNPNSLVKKIPMFGDISLQSLNYLVEHGQRPVGLHYPKLPHPEKAHSATADPFGYTLHDSHFHFPTLFWLRVYAEPLYQLTLRYVSVLRSVTLQDTPKIVVDLLDFNSPYFCYLRKNTHTTLEQIKIYLQTIGLSRRQDEVAPASQEYTFILLCDLIKQKKLYLMILLPMLVSKEEVIAAWDIVTTSLMIHSNINTLRTFIEKNEDTIKKYPHTLGVFLLMLMTYNTPEKDALALCEKLYLLEQDNQISFKWNKRDGLMLNIDKESFRFKQAYSDFRNKVTYPNIGYARLFSSEDNWLQTLTSRIETKWQCLQIKQQPPL